RLDAAPPQVGIRNPLADDRLELAYAFGFDLLSLRLALLALDAEFEFFRDVVLLGLAVDGINHERRQLNALHQSIVEDDGVSQRNAIRCIAFALHHLLAQPVLREAAALLLNFLTRGRIDLLGGVLRNDLTRQAADSGLSQQLQVIAPDRLVDHGHGVALQPKPDNEGRGQAHAVAGDGVVGLRDGLQPQIVQKYLVPGPNEVEPLVLELARIEHGAAAEAFPQHAHMAARN